MFITNDDVFKIKVYYIKKKHVYEAIPESIFEKLDEEKQKKYKCLTCLTRPLTWEMFNDVQEISTDVDSMGNRTWNAKRWKEEKLKKIIVSWDAKNIVDGKEVDVPFNENCINMLSPAIAEELLQIYDDEMLIGEEDAKK